MNMRFSPEMSTADCAVTAPIPVMRTGVEMARSMEGTQVADPRTISPVRVSVMRMDQVAEAGFAVAARAMVDAARVVFTGAYKEDRRRRLWRDLVVRERMYDKATRTGGIFQEKTVDVWVGWWGEFGWIWGELFRCSWGDGFGWRLVLGENFGYWCELIRSSGAIG